MDFFKKLGAVVCGLAPVLGAVATIVFPAGGAAVAIGTKIIGALPGLITAAENAFGDGTGPVKKQYVMEGAEKIVATMADVSTGGQKETWEKLQPFTSTIVDSIITAANGLSDQPIFVCDDNYDNMKQGL